jgi:hypothetical protein
MRHDRVSSGMIQVAEEWGKLFEVGTRKNGAEFVKLSDEVHFSDGANRHPLADACMEAHQGGHMRPDDRRFATIQAAVDYLAESTEGADLSDIAHEFADGNVSVYNTDRIAWLASLLDRAEYVDEAVNEMGAPKPFSLFDVLGWGWYAEAREVFTVMAEAIAAEAEAREDASADA